MIWEWYGRIIITVIGVADIAILAVLLDLV